MQGTTEPTQQPAAYPATDRTVPTRSPDRASYDKELVHAILDEAYVCHLGFVRDGARSCCPRCSPGSARRCTSTARRVRARCG